MTVEEFNEKHSDTGYVLTKYGLEYILEHVNSGKKDVIAIVDKEGFGTMDKKASYCPWEVWNDFKEAIQDR